jgi:lysophospholipase
MKFPMSLVATTSDPIPDSAKVEFLETTDGTRLRVARFDPSGQPRGTVVLMQGRTEFIEKYFEVIGDLLSRRFAVATLDWRGQGLSDRPLANRQKGHVGDFAHFIDDLQWALEHYVRPNFPSPYVALSHSMGGNIALRHLAQHPGVFEAACFSAPMWGIGKTERPGFAMRLVAGVGCAVGLSTSYLLGREGNFDPDSPFEGNVLTSDRERYDRFMAQLRAEPALALGSPTFCWARQALASIDALHAVGFAEAIRTPIRVCSAGADALVSVAAQSAIANRLPNAKQVVLTGARHELLMEVDAIRDDTLAQFDELIAEVKI